MPSPAIPVWPVLLAPVRDPAGRFSWLKAATLTCAILPAAVLLGRAFTDQLGPRPITEAIHFTGLWTIRFLLLSLAVTPARAVLDWPGVVMLRRMLGVTAACYVAGHFVLFCMDKGWDPLMVVSEIALRFYLTIGFVALLGLLALAFTSTNGWQKRLGARWKRLHRIVYAIGLLALFHYAVQSKADVTDAMFLTGLFAWLMYWRLEPKRWQKKLWPVAVLTVSAAVTAALVEAAWYGVRNRVDPTVVLQTNFDLTDAPRPATAVLICGAVLVTVAAMRRLRGRRAFPRGAARRA